MARTIDVLVDVLEKWGIDRVFGCPGTTEIPFVASLKKNTHIKYITTYLDGVSVGMADGYARSSGKVGVANLHATQGTLNSYGYVRAALRDESPVVIISGLPSHSYELVEPTHFIYGISDIMRSVTKWSWQVNSPDQMAHALSRAIHIAHTRPFGPTFIGIPQDVQVQETRVTDYPFYRSSNLPMVASKEKLTAVADSILKAKNPLILAGRKLGEAKAQKELETIATTLSAPVVSEAPDRGPQVYTIHMDYNHPLYAGYYSNSDKTIQKIIREADLIIEIGCKQTYSRIIKEINNVRIVQILESPNELGKYHPITFGISGDIKLNMDNLSLVLKDKKSSEIRTLSPHRNRILTELQKNKQQIQNELKRTSYRGSKIKPVQLVKAMAEVFPENTIFNDEGQSFSWFFKRYYPFNIKNIAYGTYASHIGWGMPFAAGAATHHKPSKIVCLVSDSAFLMGSQTLATLAANKLPVLVIVLNNKGFASLKIETQSYAQYRSNQLYELNLKEEHFNYTSLAKGLGVKAFSVSKPADLVHMLKKAYTLKGPSVLDVQLDDSIETWKNGWYKAPPK